MRKLIYILIFIQSIAFAQKATLDTNAIIIGDQVHFTISNEVSGTKYWPNYIDTIVNGVEIIKANKIDTSNGLISQDFIITAWDSGGYYIPEFHFSEQNKTEGLLLNVASITLEEGAQLNDIKEVMDAPIGWSDIWPWLIGVILLAAIIFLLKKYVFIKREKTLQVKPKVIIAPEVTALSALKNLEDAQLWQEGKTKEYHTELSEIIRRYTENRFNFIALELATDEILHELESKVTKEQNNSLRILLQRADLAKFAKSKPIDTENKESMTLAKGFVNATKKIANNE